MTQAQDDEAPRAPESAVSCWRCGKALVDPVGNCPYCNASPHAAATFRPTPGERPAILRLFWFYGVFLATSVAYFHITEATDEEGHIDARGVLLAALVMSVIDAGIIGLAYLATPRSSARVRAPATSPAFAWICFPPCLAVMLAVNTAYHWALNEWIRFPEEWTIEFSFWHDEKWLALIVVCFLPAVFEELFCRGLLFGALREHLGGHSSVWVSALMFGLLHIGVPLSIPYLILLGAFLGYARWGTGGLLLPMLLHFAHNLAVLVLEEWTW